MIGRKKNTCCWLSVLMVLLLLSCAKNDDTRQPQLRIDTPLPNDAFQAVDTIGVSGLATDDSSLEYLRFVIVNGENLSVSVPKYLYPESNSYAFSFDYMLDQPFLPTGEYTLVSTASDGVNSKSVYRDIRITGMEREFEQLLLLCRPNPLKTYLYSIGPEGSINAPLVMEHGYAASVVSQSQRKLFLASPLPSKLYAIDLDDRVPDPLIDAQPPYAQFNHLYSSLPATYVATANGDILGLNHYGQIIFNTEVNTDTEPLRIHPHQDYILSFCRNRGGGAFSIRQHYLASATFRSFRQVQFEVVEFASADNERCLIFANAQDGSAVYVYGPMEDYLFKQKDLPAGTILSALQMSGDEYVIAHEDGLFLYRLGSNALLDWNPGIQAENMAYDETNGLIYCVEGSTVSIITMDTGSVIRTINMPFPIVGIHIQYTV